MNNIYKNEFKVLKTKYNCIYQFLGLFFIYL